MSSHGPAPALPTSSATDEASGAKSSARESLVIAQKPVQREDSWRDTIESVVLAFVLAFLFRTFEAEAFVIPTGSMAPTLFGQHRDVACQQCGAHYEVGLNSEEMNRDGKLSSAYRTHSSVCPNCRFPNQVLANEIFTGDRILVNKLAYDLDDPKRWDVIVFKFPGEAKTNYIKRLAGLPGEELKIEWGDVWVRPLKSEKPFNIPRKDPAKQRRIQLSVYDDDHAPTALVTAGWPERWNSEGTKSWSADRKARAYRVDPDPVNSGSWQWLRYRHYLPTSEDWANAISGHPLSGATPKPQVITDMYAYNAQVTNLEAGRVGSSLPDLSPKEDGLQWVGDLTLNCTAEVFDPSGELLLELVEGARRYRCRIDLKTGKGELFFVDELLSKDENQGGVEFATSMNKAGEYRLSFANVDNRLCLWINDQLAKTLEFDPGSAKFPLPPPTGPSENDLSPAAVAGRGAKFRISHLQIERDIYYRYASYPNIDEFRPTHNDAQAWREMLQDPEALSKAYQQAAQEHRRELEREREMTPAGRQPRYPYQLHDFADNDHDEFLVLGDNSPRSNDSRLWEQSSTVERRLLIGKAFWIYWPHGIPFLNDGKGYHLRYYRAEDNPGGPKLPDAPSLSVPFYPQWDRWTRMIR
jgi:signal peptidase I